MTKITREHTSFEEQSFRPKDASPHWQSVPLSCPLAPGSPNTSICKLSPISRSPRPFQMQCYLYQQPHSHDPRTSALSLDPRLTSVSQSYVWSTLLLQSLLHGHSDPEEAQQLWVWPPSFCFLLFIHWLGHNMVQAPWFHYFPSSF